MSVRILVSFLLLGTAFVYACGQGGNAGTAETTTPAVEHFTFNGTAATLKAGDFRYVHETVFLSAAFLDTQMHLGLQELVPGKQIGICTDMQCIPYGLFDKDKESDAEKIKSAAFKDGENFYIPIENLMQSLGGTAEWDAAEKKLAVTLELHD